MSNTLNISRFSSLLFSKDFRAPFEKDVCGIQTLAVGDEIRVQYTLDGTLERPVKVELVRENGTRTPVTTQQLSTDGARKIMQFAITGLAVGIYSIEIIHVGVVLDYSVFRIIPLAEAENTVLLRYSHRRNEFDTVFNRNNANIYFSFRAVGGFLSESIKFNVDNNTFRDQRNILRQLSQFPSYIETLTIGDGIGVTKWTGEKLNLLFSCDYVTVNGKSYVRSEGSAPELMQLGDYHPLFAFKIDLEPSEFYADVTEFTELPWILETGKWNMSGMWYNDGIWKSTQ